MVSVPQQTVEKPLTPVDYIAAMSEQCKDMPALITFANACPAEVVQDYRFARAFKQQLDSIKEKGNGKTRHANR